MPSSAAKAGMVQGGAQTRPNVIAAQVANFTAFFLEMLVIEPPPDDQATAIAQTCKRFTYDDAVRLSCRHDNGRERDAMLNGIYTRETAFSEAGFSRR